jgi:hypothetical protein
MISLYFDVVIIREVTWRSEWLFAGEKTGERTGVVEESLSIFIL